LKCIFRTFRELASFFASLLQFAVFFYVATLNCTADTQQQSAIVFVTNGKLSRNCIKFMVHLQLSEFTFTCMLFDKKNDVLLP